MVAGHILGGRYRLDEALASGGMAQVWRGTDEVLRRAVAIKVLHPHLTSDETFVRRFRQEAIAVAKLSHPAIVNVYDTCSEGSTEAIVMELVSGSTLRHRLDAGPIDPRIAANMAAQVAGALDMAQAAGLVHRDIKPANILISEDGRVKVGDFGIAKAAESSTELTQEGSFIGTAKYLAPEQLEGGEIDGRTDLYSLGVVLYEMLCGRAPFEADGSSATALARLHRDPEPPRQVRPSIPADLETITLRLLARKPEHRFQTASEVVAALVQAGAETGPHTASESASIATAAPLQTGAPYAPTTSTPSAPPHGRQPHQHPGTAPPGGAAPGGPPHGFAGDHTEVRPRGGDRQWLVPTLLIVLIAISLAVAGLLIASSRGGLTGSGDDDTPGGGEEESVQLTEQSINEFVDYDPEGNDDGEHPEDLPNLTDDDPTTYWETSTYFDADIYGTEKSGVGIYAELEDAAEIQAVEIASPSDGWNVEIYVADEAGESLSDWDSPVAGQEGIEPGTTRIEFEQPAEGEYVLVYVTRASGQKGSFNSDGELVTGADGEPLLEPVANSSGAARFTVALTEVRVLG